MLSLWLLPLGFLLLAKNKSRRPPKALSSESGIVFTCNKIEIVNKAKANSYIDSLILQFRKAKNVKLVDDLDTLDVFQFVVSNLNKLCYNRLENKTFSDRQKMASMLLFTVVFNRMSFLVKNKDEFFEHFYDYERDEIWYYLDFTEEDYESTFLQVLEDFNKNYSYPK